MYKSLFPLSLLLSFLTVVSCSPCLLRSNIGEMERGKRYIIKKDIDLQGQLLQIPEGCTLVFKNGIIKNGSVIGNNTKIRYKHECFENVDINGTWIVPVIQSSMFRGFSGSDVRSLSNLQNPAISNIIHISKGDYWLPSIRREAFPLTSNTHLIIEGNLQLLPQTNSKYSNGYYILSIRDAQNVMISGNGAIMGDQVDSSINSVYGHGIFINNSNGVDISGITIKDTNGDGIDISTGAKDICIHDVNIVNYKRNGISITDGDNISINHIQVRNGGKTSPFAAIDVEPNDGCNVSSVCVNDMRVVDCQVAISGYAKEGTIVKDVTYSNISITGTVKECIISSCFQNLFFKNVKIDNTKEKTVAIMRLLSNRYVEFDNLLVNTPDNDAKYPLYLKNDYLVIRNSSLTCPQLFSWHFSNATIEDCQFKFNSFVWTAKAISTSNVIFNRCIFDGPLFMRPQNVVIRNSVFKWNENASYVASFLEAESFNESETGVVFENNKLECNKTKSYNNLIRCNVRNSTVDELR